MIFRHRGAWRRGGKSFIDALQDFHLQSAIAAVGRTCEAKRFMKTEHNRVWTICTRRKIAPLLHLAIPLAEFIILVFGNRLMNGNERGENSLGWDMVKPSASIYN